MLSFAPLLLGAMDSTSVCAQDLRGTWGGAFNFDNFGGLYRIALVISGDTDSTLSITSYTQSVTSTGFDTILICPVEWKGKKKDSIILQEIEPYEDRKLGTQRFVLKYRKNKRGETLDGTWTAENISGKISFRKVDDSWEPE